MGAECYLASSNADYPVAQPHVPEEGYPQLHWREKLIIGSLEEYCHGEFEESLPVLAWAGRRQVEIP